MGSIEYDGGYERFLEERRRQVLAKVARAAERAGRDPERVEVVAVSKTVDVEQVAAAYAAGWRAFGENRPQELERKATALAQDPQMSRAALHMIGNLQENKINHVLGCAPALIHSIASEKLAGAVSRRAQARGVHVAVLLEVNVTGERTKSGMTPDELRECAARVCALPGIDVRGLMTMAPRADPEAARAAFGGLRELKLELSDASPEVAVHMSELSMGMSDDFEEGVRQGATIIRLGRIVFDPGYVMHE